MRSQTPVKEAGNPSVQSFPIHPSSIRFFTDLWGERKPLCQLFSTAANNYLYDTGTNKILRCEKREFELLGSLLAHDISRGIEVFSSTHTYRDTNEILLSLSDVINAEHILKITGIKGFGLFPEFESVVDQIENELGMVQLEVTENCNLRCGYCIYNPSFKEKRNHGLRRMSVQIAKKAVDYLESHSSRKEKASIGFYGGEPLLEYGLIKAIVLYARKSIKKKELRFSLTTNGTLINDEIANFLYNQGFGVMLSIDGPEEIHDMWRKDLNDNGSFSRTFRGLKHLVDAFSKEPNRLALSMVYAPPFGKEKVDRIADFLSQITWLPSDIRIMITYPHDGSIPIGEHKLGGDIHKHGYDFSLSSWARARFLEDYQSGRKSDPIANGIIENKLAKLMQRPLIDNPIGEAYLNGCCVPGVRKIYVTAEGMIKVCERMGNSPDLGNLYDGINKEVIRSRYIDEYREKSLPACSTCWLVKLCPICYAQVFVDYEFSVAKKNELCTAQRWEAGTSLRYLCTLLEINKNGLNYLYDWEFS
jgi:uncharacterized protein